MKIIEITGHQREKYNHFVEQHELGSIHQTWEWGVFQSQSAQRDRFWVVALENDHGEIEASALIIRQKLPFNLCWLYCPRGPLVDYKNPHQLKALFEKIAEIAHEQNAVFFRFDPGVINPKHQIPNSKEISNLNPQSSNSAQTLPATSYQLQAQPAHAHYQPEHTLMLDLTQTQEELLKAMKPKCRYNIKVAQKHGVTIRVSDPENLKKDIETFYHLLKTTTDRDQFSGHPQKYYEKMMETFADAQVKHQIPSTKSQGNSKHQLQATSYHLPTAQLYLAEYQNEHHEKKTVAAMIATYFKDTAIYYFGASSNEYRNVMAPYLLQWQAITDAQKAGYKFYDFLGIAPENEPDHAWAGVTNFKLKFGGNRVSYVSAQEIVYKYFWYLALKIGKKLQKLLSHKA